jgi:glycosyltransferase involved in cell wall biosynthesis
MKIGLDVAQTCVERAGCAWHADALSRALIAAGLPRGHTFALYHHFGDWINADPRRGTFVAAPGVSAPMRGLNPLEARQLWREIEGGEPLPGKPDVVLSFSFHAPKLPHTKLVYTVHDVAFWLHPEFATDATRLLCQRELLQALSRAAAFLFVSRSTRQDFDQMLGGWLEQTGRPHALSPGASRFPAADAPRIYAPEAPWLMVGSLEPRKNHAGALDAYERYLARSTQRRPLVLAGGCGWKSAALQERIDTLVAAGAPIRALGYVPDTELAHLYRTSFALLAPSWHEGFGLPLVEAMGAGLPAIIADRASLSENGGDAATRVDPSRPDDLALAMLALENSPPLYGLRAAASLARGRTFSWQATATGVLDFVERL